MDIKNQRPGNVLPILALTYLPALVLLALASTISYRTGIPMGDITRDPVSIMNAHFYTGIISNIGVLFWSAAAVACLFTHTLIRRDPRQREFSAFCRYFGLVTGALMLDDFFLLHEITADLLHVSELAIFALYGLAVCGGIIRFRGLISQSHYPILASALGLVAISIIADAVPDSLSSWHYLLEDGPKFLGIAGWCGYFTATCWQKLAHSLPAVSAAAEPAAAQPPPVEDALLRPRW